MIISVLSFAATVFTSLLLLMSVVFATEVIVARRTKPCRSKPQNPIRKVSVAVLIPAHNEQASLEKTLLSIKGQLQAGDRIIVIADNCSDSTAKVARALGAEVIERTDDARRGKGYALQFGIDHLSEDSRPVVICVDADCKIIPSSIDVLCAAVEATGRPVQALNLIEVEPDASLQDRLGAFAFKVKNYARFEGLRRLGFACPLAGTGMAFPWSVIKNAKLASGNIVEDLNLGIDLAIEGHPAIFEDRAMVTSGFPEKKNDQVTQRRRWEHGHIQTIMKQVPRLLGQAVRQFRSDLLVMAADLFVVPLSLHAFSTALMVAATGSLFLLGGSAAGLILSVAAAMLLVIGLVFAWQGYGRELVSAKELLQIPVYIAQKLPIYLGLLRGPERHWIRSARKNDEERK